MADLAEHGPAPGSRAPSPVGIVALNLGGPDSPAAVEPFLYNLFSDPDTIQLPPAVSLLQKPLARFIARRRSPYAARAYRDIGGRSHIADETAAQAAGVAAALAERGAPARPYLAMACWHPFSEEAVGKMKADGTRRAVAVPLYPQWSRATTGASFRLLDRALAGSGIEIERVERYPDAPGYVQAVADHLLAAIEELPPDRRHEATVLFSAHGLPESYVRRGDPYLDEVRTTVQAVSRRLHLGRRACLAFQSRVGPQRWLQPSTDDEIRRIAAEGERALVICPISFTGEHVETLQEIDILYRGLATELGIAHFARARTAGTHPAFLSALADLALCAMRRRGWA